MQSAVVKLFYGFITLSLMMALIGVNPVNAATLTVNTLVDENDGSCLDGDCSLRDAIQVAAENDTINFSVNGSIILSLGQLTINKNLTITGPGAANLTISGNNLTRIFFMPSTTPTKVVSISGITMTNGYADPTIQCGGGAIYSSAFLTLNNVVLNGHSAPAGVSLCQYPRGGAISVFENKGSLTITNSTISNSSTYWDGGGIYFSSTEGTLSLTNVVINGNQSTNSNGGGVSFYNGNAPAVIDHVTFNNNDTSQNGGGLQVANGKSALITNSTFSNNSTTSGNGGAFIADYNVIVTILNTTFLNNFSANKGGALYLWNSTTTIGNSTFTGNFTNASSSSRDGGAIYNLGRDGTSTLVVYNSTFTGNSATNGKGGAIMGYASHSTQATADISTVTIINSTIVGNTAQSSGVGGGVYSATDSNASETSTLTLQNSIIFGNTLVTGTNGANCAVLGTGTIVTNSNNLFNNVANDCVAGATDVASTATTAEVVNTLADNGGETQTMSLPIGSPAIDAGDSITCVSSPIDNLDQRGLTRSQGGACDIGAFEFGASPDVTVTIGGTLQGTYSMQNDESMVQSYPVVGGPVVISSNNGTNIIASLLQLRRPGTSGGWTGISQLMGVQQDRLSDTYVLPHYNGADSTLYNSIQVANYDVIDTNVTITIAGTLMGTYPLAVGASINQVYTGTVGGPVVIRSDNGAQIIASLYELKRAGTSGPWSGQSQMMGLPQSRLATTYAFPRYNDTLQDLDAYLVFANADSISTNVTVTIGGVLQGTYPMNANTSQVVSYPVVGGPVVIASDNGANIIASMLQLRRPGTSGGWTGISQLMGVRMASISDSYVLPRYNGGDSTLYNSVQVANFDSIGTNVSIIIGGTLMGTYPLAAGASLNQVYSGTVNGPIEVTSDNGALIVVSLYELKRSGTSGPWTGQSQMMAIPFAELSDTYVFPRYNDTLLDLDASLIFVVP